MVHLKSENKSGSLQCKDGTILLGALMTHSSQQIIYSFNNYYDSNHLKPDIFLHSDGGCWWGWWGVHVGVDSTVCFLYAM